MRFQNYLASLERTAQRLPALLEQWDSLSADLRDDVSEDIWMLLASKDQALSVVEGNAELSQRVIDAATMVTALVMSHPEVGVDASCLYPCTAIESEQSRRSQHGDEERLAIAV